jgi:hypothetical protein
VFIGGARLFQAIAMPVAGAIVSATDAQGHRGAGEEPGESSADVADARRAATLESPRTAQAALVAEHIKGQTSSSPGPHWSAAPVLVTRMAKR